MTIITTARRLSLAIAATSSLLVGVAGFSGSAFAASHADTNPNGFVNVETCTSLSGSVTVTPGLRRKAHAESAVVSGSLDGCSFEGQSQPGQGSFTAIISGAASKKAGSLSGTFTANWPASAGLNPSNGTVTITNSSAGLYTISGSVTSGALVGTTLSSGYVVTGTHGNGTKNSPVTEQNFVNTAPFNLGRNGG